MQGRGGQRVFGFATRELSTAIFERCSRRRTSTTLQLLEFIIRKSRTTMQGDVSKDVIYKNDLLPQYQAFALTQNLSCSVRKPQRASFTLSQFQHRFKRRSAIFRNLNVFCSHSGFRDQFPSANPKAPCFASGKTDPENSRTTITFPSKTWLSRMDSHILVNMVHAGFGDTR